MYIYNGIFLRNLVKVPYFGPLYNEVIVQKCILANVVRCTAINASCAKRSMIPFYQQ